MDNTSHIDNVTWKAQGKRVVAHRNEPDLRIVAAFLFAIALVALVSGLAAVALSFLALGFMTFSTMRPVTSFEAASENDAREIASRLNQSRESGLESYRQAVREVMANPNTSTNVSAVEQPTIEASTPTMPKISDVKLKAQVDAALLGLRTHNFTGPTVTNLSKIIAYIPRLNDVQRGDLDLITTTIVKNTDRISESLRENSGTTGQLMTNLSKITSQSSPVLVEMRESFDSERANDSSFDVNYISSRFPSGSLNL